MGIKFIEDHEIDLSLDEIDDLLGTKPYSETLFDVIKQSRGKQNIGLFGGWGSGKSTIIKTLESLIQSYNKENNQKKIGYFKYDAWKYSNDDFRRSFILNFNQKFKVIEEKELENKLYRDITVEGKDKIDVKVNYHKITPYLIVTVLLIAVIVWFLPFFEEGDKLLITLLSIVSTYLLNFSGNIFRIAPQIIKQSRILEAEKFEETFKNITEKIFTYRKQKIIEKAKSLVKSGDSKKYKADNFEKLVIVIDNLDRCDKENLLVTLSSMKNFLENDKIIFVLPVDENGITSFLNKDVDDADEYLRKIFHQIIRLKKFTPKELVEFTKVLNDKYKLELSNNGIRLICQEFTTNPRKIIQFLNNLQTERSLIKRQIKEKYIQLVYDSEADDFLIKLLIIKQEWSDLYKMVLDDIQFLNKLNEAIKRKIEFKNERYIVKVNGRDLKLRRNQKRFFSRNISINCKNIEPFILNIDFNKDVPDELRIYIENGELEEAFDVLSIDSDDIKSNEAIIFLDEMEAAFDYNNNKFGDYSSISSQLVKLLMKLIKFPTFQDEIKSNFRNYSFIDRIFNNNEFVSLLNDIEPLYEVCELIKWFDVNLEYKLAIKKLREFIYSFKLEGDSFEKEKIKAVNTFINIFKYDILNINHIKYRLGIKVIANPESLDLIDVFDDDLEISKAILTEARLKDLVINLKEEKITEGKIKDKAVRLIETFIKDKHLSNKEVIAEYANLNFKELETNLAVQLAKTKGVFELKDKFKKLRYIIPLADKEKLEVNKETFNQIYSAFNSEYVQELSDFEIQVYDDFLNLIVNLMHLDVKIFSPYKDSFEKFFNKMFVKLKHKKISKIINRIYQKEIKYYNDFEISMYNSIVEKLSISNDIDYVSTLAIMLEESGEEIVLSKEQKININSLLIKHYLAYYKFKTLRGIVVSHLNYVVINHLDEFKEAIENLEKKKLKTYVYNIYRANSDNLIANSFVQYLIKENHYGAFRKFVRFVKENYSEKMQHSILKEYATSKYRYDWFFSFEDVIYKSVFNDLIVSYLKLYQKEWENLEFLKNLEKLDDPKSLYKPTIYVISEFLNNIINPSKHHSRKIKTIKKKLNI